MNIYVGNIAYSLEEDEMRGAFEAFGEVSSAKIIMDRETGRSKGFAFVEMPDDDAARRAIEELNGSMLSGRSMRVNEARPRPPRQNRGGYGHDRNGGYGRGDNYGRGGGNGYRGDGDGYGARGYGRGNGYNQNDGYERRDNYERRDSYDRSGGGARRNDGYGRGRGNGRGDNYGRGGGYGGGGGGYSNY